MHEAVALAGQLIRLRTDGGAESSACDLLSIRLEGAGFRVHRTVLSDGRENLQADLVGDGPPLVLTGHLDTVPVGREDWEYDAFGGEVAGGALHGRGSVDMKAGVAAMVVAGEHLALDRARQRSLRLLFTAGEETGCLGATSHVASGAAADPVSAVLVGEPTSCSLVVAHKGVLWLRIRAHGRGAHASTPHLGDNAITKLVAALGRLGALELAGSHPQLGTATWSLGTIAGGSQTNVVPAEAEASLDVRLVPRMAPVEVTAAVQELLGRSVDVEVELALPAVETPVDDRFVELVAGVLAEHGVSPGPGVATYFTDASVLAPAFGHPPVVICGPGEAALAHQRDERCELDQIELATEIYSAVGRSWVSGAH